MRTRKPRIVAEEERLLAGVLKTLASAPRPVSISHYDRELVRLRDALVEEKLPDDRARLLEQMDRLAAISTARARYTPGQVDPASPYFAHLAFANEEDQQRDVLLGKQTFIHGNVRIVDWRDAPISKVFYRYREGDAFVEEIADRRMSGEVLARRTITIVGGRLLRVAAGRRTYLRSDGAWQEVSSSTASFGGGAGSAIRPDTARPLSLGLCGWRPGSGRELRPDKHLPEIAALLDREQFDLLTSDGERLLVVAGGAGSGKTTVGLHRIAYLHFSDPERFRARRMQVLVFGTALARYISWVLPALGVKGVPVRTLAGWAAGQQHKHFPALVRRTTSFTPASVVRFKTHRIMIPMLAEAARTAPGARPADVFDELFTDHGWIAAGVDRYAPGAFSKEAIDEIHTWCTRLQFTRADGPGADDEQPCYDEEDSMILLRLHQLLRGRLMWSQRRKLSYDHLMVDEAQDFSPLELAVLMETVRGKSVTLAGDSAQKLTDNDFSDWSEVLTAVGLDHRLVSPLKVSYRSTRPIMELANAVLGPLAPEEPSKTVRDGEPVELLRFGGSGAALTFLGDALGDLQKREPKASVAILTCDQNQAQRAYRGLRRNDLSELSLVLDQRFSFGPGIEISDVAQTKGLEFDYVVLLGTDGVNYPDTPQARHLLHVGMSRAIHQLWLVTWKRASPLLPDWIEARLAG
ncbi:MAG TPA: 3'-5' exonuclease [Myxococcota bacterium]|nr:3'-5' exonuclease [Myxococcota bacterium]